MTIARPGPCSALSSAPAALLALPALGLLTACGGSGSSIASTPPPPSPTYSTLADRSPATQFTTRSAAFGYASGVGTLGRIDVSYDAATKTYRLQTALPATGETIEQNFGPAQAAPNNAGFYTRMTDDGSRTDQLTIGYERVGGSAPTLTYAGYGEWTIDRRNASAGRDSLFFTYGVPTLVSDMPKTGSAHYALQIHANDISDGVGVYAIYGSGSLTANFASATFSVQLAPESFRRITGDYVIVNITGNGTIGSVDGTPGFTGTLTADGATGSVAGRFYGPQASEVAGVFAIGGIAGAIVGGKN